MIIFTPILKDLHWLPVRQRIIFKIVTLTDHCRNVLVPPYLAQLLVPYSLSRSLRSSDSYLLKEPRTRTKSYGNRAFINASPRLWSKWPLTIRQSDTLSTLKSCLKKYLFQESFKHKWTFCILLIKLQMGKSLSFIEAVVLHGNRFTSYLCWVE